MNDGALPFFQAHDPVSPSQDVALHVRLVPVSGESMLSWLHRLAAANGYSTVRQLLRDLNLHSFCNADLDAVSDPHFFEALSGACMLDKKPMRALSLRSMEGALVFHFANGTHHHWLLPKVGKNESPSHAARYMVCRSCMGSGGMPYWRLYWRQSLQTECHRHKSLLLDRCPACREPFTLGLGKVSTLSRCAHCNTDISLSKVRRCSNNIDLIGRLAYMTGKIQPSFLTVSVAYEFQFWDGLWALIVVLRTLRINTGGLRGKFPAWVRGAVSNCYRLKETSFEYWDVESRRQVTRLLGWLLEDWPDRVVALFSELRILKSNLYLLNKEAPFWVDSVFELFLSRPKHLVSKGEILAAAKIIAGSGGFVSRIAVKKLLGVTESKRLTEILDEPTERFTADWLAKSLKNLDRKLRACRHARDEWASMVRDLVAISLAILGNLTFEQLVGLSMDQAKSIWITPSPTLDDEVREHVLGVSFGWRQQYERLVRPEFVRRKGQLTTYLITRFGDPYGCNGLPKCFANTMRHIGYAHPERGCKVFADLHAVPPIRVPS